VANNAPANNAPDIWYATGHAVALPREAKKLGPEIPVESAKYRFPYCIYRFSIIFYLEEMTYCCNSVSIECDRTLRLACS
jgi:hypothetical protein